MDHSMGTVTYTGNSYPANRPEFASTSPGSSCPGEWVTLVEVCTGSRPAHRLYDARNVVPSCEIRKFALNEPINSPETAYVGAIAPHGGTLINRRLRGEMAQATRELAKGLRQITLSPVNISDLELIATGAFSPLTGFMNRADYQNVVHNMHLASGLPWTIPVTLAVDEDTAGSIEVGQSVALAEPDPAGGTRLLGVLEVAEKYPYDKEAEAAQVYRTTESA